jgi:hypothetical protein
VSRWKRKKRAEKRRNGPRIEIDERRVVILVPCDDMVKMHFMISLVSMVQYTLLQQPENLTHFVVQPHSTSILPLSRQKLAEAAIEQGATHTLWLDSDMQFPADTLMRFLLRDEAIIGINATSRRPPFRNTAQVQNRVPLVTNPGSTGLEKVHRMGFGVLWVATEVYKAMERPYFDFEWVEELGTFKGEDYIFFEKARAAGYELYVDHDLSKHVHHMGTFGFNPLLMARTAEVTQAAT